MWSAPDCCVWSSAHSARRCGRRPRYRAATQELNSAELIADDLLETVRSKVETATDYIKCYDSGTDVTNKTGSSEGSAIEFGYETEQGYNAAELLTADGCRTNQNRDCR